MKILQKKGKTEIKIIEAQDSHVPEIMKMWVKFMNYHRDLDPFFQMRRDGHKKAEEYIRNLLKSEDSQILVAIKGDKIVGYSIAVISKHPPVLKVERYGFIDDLSVKPRYRRTGIGAKMLERILEWFESKGIKRIELKVVPTNEIGYSFWKKHGFREYLHFLYLDK